MKNAVFLTLTAVGLALYVAGALWPNPGSAAAIWTDAKASRLPEVTGRLAELSYLLSQPVSLHGGPDRGAALREMVDLTRERESLLADFDAAIKQRVTPAGPLKASGISLAMIGVVAWSGMRLRELKYARRATTGL